MVGGFVGGFVGFGVVVSCLDCYGGCFWVCGGCYFVAFFCVPEYVVGRCFFVAGVAVLF